MLVEEVMESAGAIPDPYVKAITYAKLGEKLVRAGHPLFKDAFMRALDTAREIEDPAEMLRALISIGYSMGRSGIRSYKRIFLQVSEDSKVLPDKIRAGLLRSIAVSLLRLGEFGDAITYAVEIGDSKIQQETLVHVVRYMAKSIERKPIRVAYTLRKIRLALEYITDEPYRSKALLELMKALIALGSYENALSVIREMGSKDWARQAFKELIYRLKSKGVLDRYIGSVEEMASELVERFGESFTVELATAFALSGKSEVAVSLLRKAGEGVLSDVALELLKKYPSALPGFIEALSEEEALTLGKRLMNAILEEPKLGNWDVIRAITVKARSEEILAKVARYYIILGRVEDAKRIGLVLQDVHLRSIVMADVARFYLSKGKVEEAIDAALEVSDPGYTSILMSEILVKALDAELGGERGGKAHSDAQKARRQG